MERKFQWPGECRVEQTFLTQTAGRAGGIGMIVSAAVLRLLGLAVTKMVLANSAKRNP
ncbi:MAG: hypothetical protein AW10_00222 [Candidatus Accumulibacter appositus]|uniref:Uncharacterized protein n=1 Tax=Candidatus Accumulibacter appositus TaxID=1454003 RepID=A0A011NJS3_9PROT|nr:MAG: hypothetical protein AW10_00222 [Candidatus Accumulibacter appositus]